MDIVYPCNHCRNRITAPAQFAGREVTCPKCHGTVQLPDSLLDEDDLLTPRVSLSSSVAPVEDQRVVVRCDQCFQQYIVPAASADHEFECAKCQHTFRVPAAALDAAQGAVIGGIEKLKSAMASDTLTLGDEMLAELGLLDKAANEGSPLRAGHSKFDWLPKWLRRPITAAMNFVEQHPIALVAIVVGIGAWAAVLVYFFR